MTLAYTQFLKQLRSGAFNLILAALLLATFTATTVSLSASAIKATLDERATHVLAGDAQIVGSQTLKDQWLEQAQSLGLQTSTSLSFRGMVFSETDSQIFYIKAVDQNYPLKGEIELNEEQTASQNQQPAGNTIFAPKPLLLNLNVAINDRVYIGDAEFTISHQLIREPDNFRGNFGFAPTLLMNRADVPKTGVVQTGSRIQTTLYLAGDEATLEAFYQWVKPQLGDHFKWRNLEQSNQSISKTLDKAHNFFQLGIILSILLSGIAIGLGARKYVLDQVQVTALLKTFGLGPKQIAELYFMQLVLLGLLGTLLGILFGWLGHQTLMYFLTDLLPDLQSAKPSAYFVSGICIFCTLFAFSSPYFARLHKVSPMAVFRQKQNVNMLNNRIAFYSGFAVLSLVALLLTQQWQPVVYLVVAIVLCFILNSFLANILGNLLYRTAPQKPPWLNLGVQSLAHHHHYNTPQIAMLSMLFSLIFIMVLVRTTLIDEWQAQIPDDAPNFFVFNVFEEDKKALTQYLNQAGDGTRPFYPMQPSKLVLVKGQTIDKAKDNQSNNVNYDREMNVSWTNTLGDDNEITAGVFWRTDTPDMLQASLEERFAQGLNLNIGDTITLSAQGKRYQATITSLRSVRWDSFNPNFFIIVNQPLAQPHEVNWISSFHLAANKQEGFYSWLKEHPTITLIEVEQSITLIKEIITQVSQAVEFIGLLVLASGFLVMVASLQISQTLRSQESATLRVFGASNKTIGRMIAIEYVFIATLACLIACVASELAMFFLSKKLFQLSFTLHPEMWLFGPVIAVPAVTMLCVASVRKTLTAPPLATLRNIAQ